MDGSATSYSDFIADELSTADYGKISKFNGVDKITLDGIATRTLNDGGVSYEDPVVLDCKGDTDYCYILWRARRLSDAKYVLLLSRVNKYGNSPDDPLLIASNGQYVDDFTDSFSLYGANYLRRTATIEILNNHIAVTYVHKRDAGNEYPVFSGGTVDNYGIMLTVAQKDLVSVNYNTTIMLPESGVHAREVGTLQRFTTGGSGVIKFAIVCTNTTVTPPYGVTIESEIRHRSGSHDPSDTVLFDPLYIAKLSTDFSSTDDIVGLPQAFEVDNGGSPEFHISYSLLDYVPTGSDAFIMEAEAVDRVGGDPLSETVLFAMTNNFGLTGPPPYYLLHKSDEATFNFAVYDRVAAVPQRYAWHHVARTLSSVITQSQLYLLDDDSDPGGDITGAWVNSSGAWDNAEFIMGWKSPDSENPIFSHIDQPHTGAPTRTTRQPLRSIPYSRNYIITKFDEIPCVAHTIYPSSSTGQRFTRPVYPGAIIDCDLGNTGSYRSGVGGFSELTAKGAGESDLEFGDVDVNYGVRLLGYNVGLSQWKVKDSTQYTAIDLSNDNTGIGLKYTETTANTVIEDTPPASDRAQFLLVSNVMGELRDPSRAKFSFLALQPAKTETGLITVKDASTLGVAPSKNPDYLISLIEADYYDDSESLVKDNGNSGSSIDIEGPSGYYRLISPFFIRHEENFKLTKIAVNLIKFGSPTDIHDVELHTFYGNVPNKRNEPRDLLWSGTLDPASIPVGSPTWVEIPITSTVILESSVSFCVSVIRPAVYDLSNLLTWKLAGSSTFDYSHKGIRAGASTWILLSQELSCRVYGESDISKVISGSRDGGTTWNTFDVSVMDQEKLNDGYDDGVGETEPKLYRHLLNCSLDVRSQPSGANPKMKAEILGQPIDIRTLALHWK
jgi:hypothetical protein